MREVQMKLAAPAALEIIWVPLAILTTECRSRPLLEDDAG